jgi:tetratricopeptide (TPR) repeat protein
VIWVSFLVLVGGLVWNQRSLRLSWKLSSARSALEQRDAEQALAVLGAARDVDPKSGEVEYLSAKAWRRLGRLDEVSSALERAAALGFDPGLLRREQWLAAAQAGQMSIAEPHLADLLTDPRDEGAEICEAYVNGYFRIGSPLRAIPLIEAWKKEFPEDERPWLCRGSFHETSDAWEEAEEQYREALQRAPGNSTARLSLAKVLVRQHKFRDAEPLYQQELAEGGQSPATLAGWADCLWEMGRVDEAREVYQQLLDIDPANPAARWGIARWQSVNREYEEASGVLQALVDEFPHQQEYRHALARSLQATGKSDEAGAHFRWLAEADAQLSRVRSIEDRLSKDPHDTALRYELGRIRLHYSSPEEGVRMLLSVLDISPEHVEARQALSEYYRQQGDERLARRFADHGDAP